MNALLIQINGNTMAVVLDNVQLANQAMDILQKYYYEGNKNSDTFAQKGIATLQDYLKHDDYKWSIAKVPVTSTATLSALTNLISGRISPATHSPETFPHPGHTRIPGQTQLVRKQLPTTRAAVPHSDRSDPNPGVPREHRRVSSTEAQAREEHDQ